MILNSLFKMKLIKNKYILPLIGFLAFLGFLDATYLTILHYKNVIPPCSVIRGCETVLTSQFATLWGIPIALFGVLFYIAVISVCILFYHHSRKIFANAIFFIASTGIVVSTILFYIQMAILKTFCQYCLISESINLLIFFLSYLLIKAEFKPKKAKSA